MQSVTRSITDNSTSLGDIKAVPSFKNVKNYKYFLNHKDKKDNQYLRLAKRALSSVKLL